MYVGKKMYLYNFEGKPFNKSVHGRLLSSAVLIPYNTHGNTEQWTCKPVCCVWAIWTQHTYHWPPRRESSMVWVKLCLIGDSFKLLPSILLGLTGRKHLPYKRVFRWFGHHWFWWFLMVVHHWSDDGMVIYHRWSLVCNIHPYTWGKQGESIYL